MDSFKYDHNLAGVSRCIRAQTGWPCHCLSYKGMRQSLRQNAMDVAAQTREVARGRPVFVVTHSMGALVLRYICSLPDAGALSCSMQQHPRPAGTAC